MSHPVVALALIYSECSLLAVGGVNSVLSEMQRQVVDRQGWMSPAEFADLFALAQAAPGPNMMVSTLVGWRVAGLPGALVATAGMIGPSSLLTWGLSSLWHRFRHASWRRVVQAGLVPVTVGLMMAGAGLLAASTTAGVTDALITLGVTAALLGTRLHPLWLLAAGALLGALGLA